MDYGVWTLVPVLLVIVFALKTKRTLESLIFGTMLRSVYKELHADRETGC